MKKTRLLALCAFLLPLAGFAAPPTILSAEFDTPFVTTIENTVALTNPPLVFAQVQGAKAVWVRLYQDPKAPYSSHPDSAAYYNVFLTEGSGNTWQADLPVNVSGEAAGVLFAESEDGEVVRRDLGFYTATEEISQLRKPSMAEWYKIIGGSEPITGYEEPDDGYWCSVRAYCPDSGLVRITASASEATSDSTRGKQGLLRTLVAVPVGEIWFKARFTGVNQAGTLVVETSEKPNYRGAHDVISTYSLDRTLGDDGRGAWTQFHIVLNETKPIFVRLRNTTIAADSHDLSADSFDITDIMITPPAPDVVIEKDEVDYHPGYPSVLDPIDFKITLKQKFEDFAASNLTPKLVWRQEGGDWNATEMTNVLGRTEQGAGVYACSLTDHTAGSFEYFYRVDFAGYAPTWSQYDKYGINSYRARNKEDFSIWFEPVEGTYDEIQRASHSPSYYPDFCDIGTNAMGRSDLGMWGNVFTDYDWFDNDREIYDASHLFEVTELDTAELRKIEKEGYPYSIFSTNRIELVYPYLSLQASDGVRRFRTQYDGIAAISEDVEGAAPSYLEPAYPMQLVGDYTWQAIVPMDGAIDAYFSVTGALAYAEGATSYEAGPFEWLQLDQPETAINPPMSGSEGENGSQLRRYEAAPEKVVTPRRREVEYATYTPSHNEEDFVMEGVVPDGGSEVVYWTRRATLETIWDAETETETVSTNWSPSVEARNYVANDDGTYTEIGYGTTFDATAESNTYVTNLVPAGAYVTGVTVGTATRWVTDYVTNIVYKAVVDDPYETLRTRVQLDYEGFLMFRFCTTNGAYQIRRAAWQDFNSWQAHDSLYSRSFGLYDMQTFESDLEGRTLTTFETDFTTYFLDDLTPSDDWSDLRAGEYWDGMLAKGARPIREAAPSDPDDKASTERNGAVLLNTYPGKEGSFETTSVMRQDGRDTLTMRVRSYTDDERSVVYTADNAASSDSWKNYRVVGRIMNPTEDQVSDGEPSISLIGYWQDPFNYWEARITQKTYRTGDKTWPVRNWFEVHVYKWVDGEQTEVWGTINANDYGGQGNYQASATKRPTWPGWNSNDNKGEINNQARNNGNQERYRETFTTTLDGGWSFVFKLVTEGNAVTPVVYAHRNNDISGGTASETARNFRYECPATTGGTTYGAPGFNLRDCGLKIAPYVYAATDAQQVGTMKFKQSPTSTFGAVPTSPASSWYHSDNAKFDPNNKGVDVWTHAQGSSADTAPTTLTRKPPTVYYKLRVYREDAETSTDFTAPIGRVAGEDVSGWDDRWDAYHGHVSDGVKSVASWKWTTVEFPLAFWDETFLNVQACSTDGSGQAHSLGLLAVDSLSCATWRGKTVRDPEDSDSETGWSATYAAIAADGREGRRYEFNRSRANPYRTQALSSPLLERGVGDVNFTYQVADYPVRLLVQVVDETGAATTYLSTNLPPVTASTPMYVFFATNITGSIRIEARTPDGAADGALGTLYLDNLRATDYPNTGESSWEAYNALISTFSETSAQRRLKFDGASEAALTDRSMVLNDGVDKETINGVSFDEYQPFLQTPSIETGVGEISFWYRASPDNGGAPASLKLMVAPSSLLPEERWTQLTKEDLYCEEGKEDEYARQVAALEALSSITTDTWTYFNVEFFQQDYKVLRIVGTNEGGENRVMLDNVLITEPVRSSIDVGTIEFDPGVPLSTQDTGAKVTLTNPRMNPHDIKVYLDWYAAPGPVIDLDIPTVTINVYTQSVPGYTNISVAGQTVRAQYTLYNEIVTTNTAVDSTRVPTALSDASTRKWGYDEWKGSKSGTLAFTNEAGSAYTFLSTTKIPTTRFAPDWVVQYCVRVEYVGRFSSDILSEKQGRVRNGFWFENPAHYEPIDLNTAFGTAEAPVSHFFVFSCPTNQVWINELRPGANTTRSTQFVELIGPEGAALGNWRLEHFGKSGNVLSPSQIVYTNVIDEAALFQAANNATTNKGWGFWVLGCYGVSPSLVNQELFPADVTDNETLIMTVPGALRLRRSMGAYVDSLVWGAQNALTSFLNEGFVWSRNYSSARYALELRGLDDTLSWDTTGDYTIGGYNRDEEEALPFLTGEKVERRVPAELEPPLITAISLDGETVEIRFTVRATAESRADDRTLEPADYEWAVEGASDLRRWDMAVPHVVEPTAAQCAAALTEDGASFVVTLPNERGAARFYRIVATPAE